MHKELFIEKYYFGSKIIHQQFTADLESVIAYEIEQAKAQPEKTNKIEITPHTLVEINRAFRVLKEDKSSYIHNVFTADSVFDAMNEIHQLYEAHYRPKKEEQPEQPAPNPIREAYDSYKPIRWIIWPHDTYIKKHSETHSIGKNGEIFNNKTIVFDFDKNPHDWEIYTESEADTETQAKIEGFERHIEKHAKPWENGYPVTDQVKPKFDQDRFERMFRAVVASGKYSGDEFSTTNFFLKQLDAFYATKDKGGELTKEYLQQFDAYVGEKGGNND